MDNGNLLIKYNYAQLEVSGELDSDQELEITIYHDEGDRSVWLSENQIETLIKHLNKITS